MTSWVLAVLVVVVLGAVAVLAAGAGGGLEEPEHDRVPTGLPSSGPLQAEDLRKVRLPLAVRGYRMADVDALLERVAEQWDERSDERPDERPDEETR